MKKKKFLVILYGNDDFKIWKVIEEKTLLGAIGNLIDEVAGLTEQIVKVEAGELLEKYKAVD